jgi:FtsZ-interacting cell division protein ZipA
MLPANAGGIMGEMDTDTIGLIVLIVAVLAIIVAGKWQALKAKAGAAQRAIASSVAPLP